MNPPDHLPVGCGLGLLFARKNAQMLRNWAVCTGAVPSVIIRIHMRRLCVISNQRRYRTHEPNYACSHLPHDRRPSWPADCRTLSDMMGVVDACASIALLRQIQDEVHRWVVEKLPPETAALLNRNYVNQDANRHHIAVYLADVMHYAVTWHSISPVRGKRPTQKRIIRKI